jgi:hypothetical protein
MLRTLLEIVGLIAVVAVLWLFYKLIDRIFFWVTGRDEVGTHAWDETIGRAIILGVILLIGGLAYGGYWVYSRVSYYAFNSGPIAEENARQTEAQRQAAQYEKKKKEDEEEKLRKEEQARRMKESIAEFSTLPRRTQPANPPYLKGKLVVLSQSDERGGMELAPLSYLKDVIAGSPEEVGTVILLNNRKLRAGTYQFFWTTVRNVPGYTRVSDVTIVDRSIPAVIYKKTFSGKPPGAEVSVSPETKEVFGTKPDADIQAFLSGLERR